MIKIYQTILALIWIVVTCTHKQTHHVTIILLFDFQGWKPLCRSFSTIQQPRSTSFWLYGLLISTMPFAALRQSLSVIGWGKCFFKLFTNYKTRMSNISLIFIRWSIFFNQPQLRIPFVFSNFHQHFIVCNINWYTYAFIYQYKRRNESISQSLVIFVHVVFSNNRNHWHSFASSWWSEKCPVTELKCI